MYLFVSWSCCLGHLRAYISNACVSQGGRLVVERRMLSDLYVFDLQTHTWDKLEPAADSSVPGPRYFHSADSCEL